MKRAIIITLLSTTMLFVLAGIAAIVFFTVRGGNPFTDGNRPSATQEVNKALKIDAENPVTLKVIDDAGAVSINSANVDQVQVKVVLTAHANTEAAARAELKNIKYDIQQSGNNITLTYDLPNTTLFDFNLDLVDFFVTVPLETSVNIANNLGEVSVMGVRGDVAVKDDFGKVTLEEIEGALMIHTNSGDIAVTSIMAGQKDIDLGTDFGKITLRKVNGDIIRLDSNSGNLRLTDVRATGALNANTDFGSVDFENGSAGSLSVETNSGGVSLVNLDVEEEIFVKDDFGRIALDQSFAASYDLHTNSGSVTVDGAQGKLKADTDFGDIDIRNAESVILEAITNSGSVRFNGSLGQGPHLVKSDFGGIEFNLPGDSQLDVDLKTDFGKITSGLPVTVMLNGNPSSNGDHIVGSINGGGEQLTVQTNSGPIDIKILK